MKERQILQATKAHNVNQLHDQFIAAGIVPTAVDSSATASRFEFEDAASDAAIDAVITNHTAQSTAPPNLLALWSTYKAAVQAATTVAQLKAALVNDLGPLMKAIALGAEGKLE